MKTLPVPASATFVRWLLTEGPHRMPSGDQGASDTIDEIISMVPGSSAQVAGVVWELMANEDPEDQRVHERRRRLAIMAGDRWVSVRKRIAAQEPDPVGAGELAAHDAQAWEDVKRRFVGFQVQP
jgi:hypothetical protein